MSSTIRKFLSSTIYSVAVLASSACADRSPVGPPMDGSSIIPAVAKSLSQTSRVEQPAFGPWAKIVEGVTGPGALYAVYVPAGWNGEVIYYVHGIRPPLAPIHLDNQDNFFAVRDSLGKLGYAFVYSSFSENGLAVKDGVQRTHQLRGLAVSELPNVPTRHWLAGYSLGALVAVQLAEQFPSQYDGALAMCGMVGGTPLELQYIGDVRALFDFFYPGVLPGNAIEVPEIPMTIPQVQALVVAAISANPMGLFAIASTQQTPLARVPGNVADPSSLAFQTLVGSLINALYYQLLGTPDVRDRTHGHSPYDNRDVEYAVGTPVIPHPMIAALIAAANDRETGVARYDMPPDALNYLERHYVPTGSFQIPIVSVHNVFDPLVPFFHESALAQLAASGGSSGLLLQRAVPNYGHCNFSTPLVVGSFQTLVNWVESGTRPAN